MAQKPDKSDKNVLLQVRCKSDFKEEVRVKAAEHGKSMSAFVRETLRNRWEEDDTGTESEISESLQNGGTSTPSCDFDDPNNGQKSEISEGVYKESETGGISDNGGPEA